MFPRSVNCDIKMSFQMSTHLLGLLFFVCCLQEPMVQAFPEQGKWSLNLNESQNYNGVAKNLYKGTKIFIRVKCQYPPMKEAGVTGDHTGSITIGWILRETQVTGIYPVISQNGCLDPAYSYPFYISQGYHA